MDLYSLPKKLLGLGQNSPPYEKLEGLDYLAVMIRWRAVVMALVFACALIGLTAGTLRIPLYTATAQAVSSSDDQAPNQAMGALSGLGFLTGGASATRKETAIVLLGARTTLQEFISRNGLLPVLFEDKWDKERKAWHADAAPPTLEDGYGRMRGSIKIENDISANVVRLSVTWKDAATAASWANGLLALVNRTMQETAISRNERMISYLYREFARNENQGIRTNIANLIEEQIKARMLANSNNDYALQVIDPARETAAKSNMGRSILTLLGAAIGFLLSIPLIFFLESMAAHRARRRAAPPYE